MEFVIKAYKDMPHRFHVFIRAAVTILYVMVYLKGFNYVEDANARFTIIHTWIDDVIPFVSVFIVPYLLWFVFMFVTIAYIILNDKEGNEFLPLATALCLGCTFFLVLSYIWPNGTNIRPSDLGDSFFDSIVAMLYSTDTATNVFPSIHVFNSLVCFAAILNCARLKDKKVVKVVSGVLTVLIILSTMFLKQHSIVDVAGGFMMFFVIYRFAYIALPGRVKAITEESVAS